MGIHGVDDHGSFTYCNRGYDEAQLHKQIVGFVRHGKLNASLWLGIDDPFCLDEIDQAFGAVEQRTFVKAFVQICENPH